MIHEINLEFLEPFVELIKHVEEKLTAEIWKPWETMEPFVELIMHIEATHEWSHGRSHWNLWNLVLNKQRAKWSNLKPFESVAPCV